MSLDSAKDAAYADALMRWQTPLPSFASGHDPRSGDNAVLVLTYGSAESASRHDWLNAGRRLVDKTYLEILRHVQDLLAMQTWRAESIAASLDQLLRDRVAPHWRTLAALEESTRFDLACSWVRHAANELFGSQPSEPAASRLLFFLCPMLPIHNLSRGHVESLRDLGYKPTGDEYADYALAASRAYDDMRDKLDMPPPPAPVFGEPAQKRLIAQLLNDSDWWQRRVFDALLRQHAQARSIDLSWFQCDDCGQLITPIRRS